MENGLTYAVITTLFWGVWGAFIEVPEKRGFPATLGYVVWSLTMVPCALVALALVGGQVEASLKAVLLGALAGLSGRQASSSSSRPSVAARRTRLPRVAFARDQRGHVGPVPR